MKSQKTVRALLAAFVVCGFSVACATASDQPSSGRLENAVCASAADVSQDDLDLVQGQAEAALSAFRWQSEAQGSWRLLEVYELRGVCTDELTGFEMNRVGLGEGRALRIQDGVIAGVEPLNLSVTDPVTGAEPVWPEAGEFIAATQVDARRVGDELRRDYLGLWRNGPVSTVGSFSRVGESDVSSVRALLSSEADLTTLGYFPMPDVNAGMIGITQEMGPDATRLAVFYWEHGEWFE